MGQCDQALAPCWFIFEIKCGNKAGCYRSKVGAMLVFFNAANVTVVKIHLGGQLTLCKVGALAEIVQELSHSGEAFWVEAVNLFNHVSILQYLYLIIIF